MPDTDLSLWALFVSAFVSSTLFPGGSEAVLAFVSLKHTHDPSVLLMVATAGNTLGGMSTWGIGRFLDWWVPSTSLQPPHYQRAVVWLRQWGSPVLLLSWVPVIGDPICLAAGWLRVGCVPSLVCMALGKAGRYAVVLYLTSG